MRVDWNETSLVDLVLFMPCYADPILTQKSIEKMRTQYPLNKWMIVIGNDGIDYNWDKFVRIMGNSGIRVRWYQLEREDTSPRNGAFVRNYAIKRCRSKLFMQKDGEVFLEGDPISCAVNTYGGWRAGRVCVLSKEQTENYLETKRLDTIPGIETITIEPALPADIAAMKKCLLELDGKRNIITYFHYAFCVPTLALHSLHGYDEDYKFYGWEDVDMYLRLLALGVRIVPCAKCYAVHAYHTSTVNKEQIGNMRQLFIDKDPNDAIRNSDGWGEG